jgi:hypothetical protein
MTDFRTLLNNLNFPANLKETQPIEYTDGPVNFNFTRQFHKEDSTGSITVDNIEIFRQLIKKKNEN